MPAETAPLTAGIESTYKAREIEGFLDIHFYRKLGYQVARVAAVLGLSPAAVTWLGGLLGLAAGHLYYYTDIRLNVVGMLLHVCANIFDNADGQLARLTQRQSRYGRILDGVVDHIVWLGVYVHLILRADPAHSLTFRCLLGIFAALSHGWQSGTADYFRASYLHFLKGSAPSELDEFSAIRSEYRAIPWTRAWPKLLLLIHGNYTRQQELLAPRLHQLVHLMDKDRTIVPGYLIQARPAFKWWGFLMPNTRMLMVFAALLVGYPLGFFWAEATVFNLALIFLFIRQERMSSELLRESLGTESRVAQ